MGRLFINLGLLRNRITGILKSLSGIEKMTSSDCYASVFKPPECVRGMKELDRDAFSKEVKMHAILVPETSLQKFMKTFKGYIFKHRRASVKPMAENGKYLPVNSDFDFSQVHPAKLEELKELNIEQKLHDVTIQVRYEHYRHNEILTAIMPEGVVANSGFECVGHILHVNLIEAQKPFKNIIGQVLLDTHNRVKTVVDKTCIIDNTYRNFEMDVIAGESNFITMVVEHGKRFEFDFSKVFWNSRLQTEHLRIFEAISRDSVVFDVFAGVGPFSVPLARKGCEVYANDLNAESYKWLCHNAKLNKTTLHAFNLDGRRFITEELGKYLRSKPDISKVCVIMNLPGHAVDFLDAFPGLLVDGVSRDVSKEEIAKMNIPPVHIFCYVFSSEEYMIEDVRKRAATSLGRSLPEQNEVRFVRRVSPTKDQFCLSFELPSFILFQPAVDAESVQLEPESKRRKLEQTTVT